MGEHRTAEKPVTAHTPVLIVGGGPSGLTSALLLARHGIDTIIVERFGGRLDQPKAHAINPRSLEILRQAGFDTGTLRRQGADADESRWVNFITTVSGTLLSRLPYERQDEAVLEFTPEPLFNIPQPVLEVALEKAVLKTRRTRFIRNGVWSGYSLDADGKVVSNVSLKEPTALNLTITSDYVIGADGTDSTVRKALKNVEWEGLPGQACERIWFVSILVHGDLRKLVRGTDRAGQLYFSLLPKNSGTLIAYDLGHTWVVIRQVDPIKEPGSSFTEDKCRELVDGLLGTKLDYKVAGAKVWFTDPRIASDYSCERQKIFLVGDCAHSFPPSGGLGINTGIGDIHNLCWKLALILNEKVSDPQRLLASYTIERRPVAIANATQSWINSKVWFETLDRVKIMLDGRPSDQDVDTYCQRPEVLSELRAAVEENRPHFDSLGLQLRYSYGKPAADPPKDYSQLDHSAAPGHRLPHMWLPDGKSTLDLIPDKGFTLLTTRNTASAPRASTFQLHSREVTVHRVNIDDLPGVKEFLGVETGTSLLVRPDQHILGSIVSEEDLALLLDSII